MRFAEHIEAFGRWQVEVANHRRSGVQAALLDLRLCGRFMHEHGLDALDGPALLEFIAWLRTERHNSPAAANRKISSVKTYLRFLRFMQVDGAAQVPARELPRINVPYSGPIQTLAPEEVRRLLGGIDRTSAHGTRDFVICSLLYRLGLRVGEVAALDVADIDLSEQLITVHGKGGRRRILPLVCDMPDLLRHWLAVRTACFRTRGNDALFLSQKGGRMSVRTIEENFQKLVRHTGPYSVQHVTPHTLRHAFATHAVEESDCNLITLKAVMGHAKLTSTEIYLHPSRKTLRAAVNNHIANDILKELPGMEILTKHQKWRHPAA
ncbi:MAG: hypothetical protein A3K19_25755 [Lentisphaerae bacterium RIFOXYB12_FULL_65_16]|nr:MAG: hypothetical protein A3K18_03150 [Lentisphaerae bacterium RIFOXYA12_64_32]OGV89555.1 MAG: hypothetical protein A3K19_25755 [Lentisphaerae bacterium RIFOXYB12_FULL_65_16]